MSETELEGGVETAPAESAAADPVDVGPPGESFEGALSAEDAAVLLNALNDLLESGDVAPGVDPAAVRAYVDQQLQPVQSWVEGEQVRAAVVKGQGELESIVRDANAEYGSSFETSVVQEQGYAGARQAASEVLAGLGWIPTQIEMAFTEDPSAVFKVLGHVWGVGQGDAARHVMAQTVALMHAEASRVPGPGGVLAKYRGQVPARRGSMLPKEQTEFIRKNVRARGGAR